MFKKLDEILYEDVQKKVAFLLAKIIRFEDLQYFYNVLNDQEQSTGIRAKFFIGIIQVLSREEQQQAKLRAGLPNVLKLVIRVTKQSPDMAKLCSETINLVAQIAPADEFVNILSRELSQPMGPAQSLHFYSIFMQMSRRDLQDDTLQTLLDLFSRLCRGWLSTSMANDVGFIKWLWTVFTELRRKLIESEHSHADGSYGDLMLEFCGSKTFILHFLGLNSCLELLRASKLTLSPEQLDKIFAQAASYRKNRLGSYDTARHSFITDVVRRHPALATNVLDSALKALSGTASAEEVFWATAKLSLAVAGLLDSGVGTNAVHDFLEKILLSEPNDVELYIKFISCLSPYFNHDAEKLPSVVEKLVGLFKINSLTRGNISDLLRDMATSVPHQAFLQPLVELIQQKLDMSLDNSVSLHKAVFAALVVASPQVQVHLLLSLLHPLEQRWRNLDETRLASFDLFAGALQDGLVDELAEPVRIHCEALEKCDQYKDAMAGHVAGFLPYLLKVILRLHSLWDTGNSSRVTFVMQASIAAARNSCYRILVLLSERLSDSFFHSMIDSSELLSAALTKNIVEMELDHFAQLLEVIDSLVKHCPAPVFFNWHKLLLPPIVSRCRSSLPTLSSQSKLAPEIRKLFDDPEDFYVFMLKEAISVVQLEESSSTPKKERASCLNLIVKLSSTFRSESEPVLTSLPGMREYQLERFWESFEANSDPLLVENLLRFAKELPATGIQLENYSEEIIDCDSKQGYVVTRMELSGEEEDLSSIIEACGGAGAHLALQKLFLSTSPEMVQSEMVVKLQNEEKITKWLVAGYQRALIALLFTVPILRQRVLVIGLGAGMLSMFVRDVIHLHVTSVDISDSVVRLAKKFFGVEESDKLQIHVKDGLDFVKTQRSGVYDAVIVDVLSNQSAQGVKAPPPGFLEPEFLSNCRRIIHGNGAVIMNTIIKVDNDDYTDHQNVENILQQAIGEQVFNILHDNNVCFIAFPSKREDPKAEGRSALNLLMEDVDEEDYSFSCLENIAERLETAGQGEFDDSDRKDITEA